MDVRKPKDLNQKDLVRIVTDIQQFMYSTPLADGDTCEWDSNLNVSGSDLVDVVAGLMEDFNLIPGDWVTTGELVEGTGVVPVAPAKVTVTDVAYINAAIMLHHKDGEVEIDDDAKVSRGEDPGAYVQAWVWVYDDDVKEMKL
jgi:hypothetical protein